MAVTGFNVGSTMSLKDIGLAVDYFENKDSFEPDLEDIKEKITSKQIGRGKGNTLTVKGNQGDMKNDMLVECGKDVGLEDA